MSHYVSIYQGITDKLCGVTISIACKREIPTDHRGLYPGIAHWLEPLLLGNAESSFEKFRGAIVKLSFVTKLPILVRNKLLQMFRLVLNRSRASVQ